MRERGRGDWRRVVTDAIVAALPASEAFQRGATGMGRCGADQPAAASRRHRPLLASS